VVRGLIAVLLGIACFQLFGMQSLPKVEGARSISITFPEDIPSEAVEIRYFLRGPFGGYSSYVKQQPKLHSYDIATSVEGKAATEVRVIAYAPGCVIQRFILPLHGDSSATQAFDCRRLPTVSLSGQIAPSDFIRGRNTELTITYMAYWAHEFFGIADGIVTQIELARASPDTNGMFQFDLPDFTADTMPFSHQERASLHLALRDAKTWNPIPCEMEGVAHDLLNEDHGLQIRSYYPELKIQTSIPNS